MSALRPDQILRILEITDSFNLHRESIFIPLKTEENGSITILPDGRLRIVCPEQDNSRRGWCNCTSNWRRSTSPRLSSKSETALTPWKPFMMSSHQSKRRGLNYKGMRYTGIRCGKPTHNESYSQSIPITSASCGPSPAPLSRWPPNSVMFPARRPSS